MSTELAVPSTLKMPSSSHNSHKSTPTVWPLHPSATSAATVATTAITTGDHRLKETGVHTTSKDQSDREQLFDTEHLPTVNTLDHGTQPTTDDKYCTYYTITANYYTYYTNTTTTIHTTTLHTNTPHTRTMRDYTYTTHVNHVTHTTLHTPSVTKHYYTHNTTLHTTQHFLPHRHHICQQSPYRHRRLLNELQHRTQLHHLDCSNH